MSLRVLVTRPEEGGLAIAARLAQRGHQALLAPLLFTRFFEGPEPDWHGVQAILATSANGVRALAKRTARRDLPLFAVGPQTAAQARAAGFTRVRAADGDAKALAQAAARWAAPGKGALLHIASKESKGIPAQALPGFEVRQAVLYTVEAAAELPAEARAALKEGAVDAALFFSPRSARIFCKLVRGIDFANVTAAAISPATAAALAPLRFGAVRVAAKPGRDALLDLL